MPIVKPPSDILSDPFRRRRWVKDQLHGQGTSLRALALAAGVRPQAVYQALLTPSRRLEEVIARALGLTAAALFPERHDPETGERLHRTRPDASTRGGQRPRQKERAA